LRLWPNTGGYVLDIYRSSANQAERQLLLSAKANNRLTAAGGQHRELAFAGNAQNGKADVRYALGRFSPELGQSSGNGHSDFMTEEWSSCVIAFRKWFCERLLLFLLQPFNPARQSLPDATDASPSLLRGAVAQRAAERSPDASALSAVPPEPTFGSV